MTTNKLSDSTGRNPLAPRIAALPSVPGPQAQQRERTADTPRAGMITNQHCQSPRISWTSMHQARSRAKHPLRRLGIGSGLGKPLAVVPGQKSRSALPQVASTSNASATALGPARFQVAFSVHAESR